LHVLHHDIGTILEVPEAIDVNHVWVVQAGEVLSLGGETREFLIAERSRSQDLHRDRALELQVAAFIDHAEPAFTDEAVHAITAIDHGSDHVVIPEGAG